MKTFRKELFTKKIIKYFFLLVSLLLSAFVYNLVFLPSNLVIGGTNGLATIINHVYGVSPSTVLYIFSAICLILSYLYLGKEDTIASLAAGLIYPTLVKLTANISELIYIKFDDMLTIIIFAGFLYGLSNGLMYKTGYSNSGLPTISKILYKYYKIPITRSSTIMNTIIVLSSGFLFDWNNVMYAIIVLYIDRLMINKVLLGISNNKAFYIITSKDEQVRDYIIRMLGHSVTIFDVKGGFLEKKKNVLLTVIPTNEYYKVTEGIKLIDENAFFLATDAYEVFGGK